MDVQAAYRVVKSLDLTPAQERKLAALLKGEKVSPAKRKKRVPVISVSQAERIFTRMIRNKGS